MPLIESLRFLATLAVITTSSGCLLAARGLGSAVNEMSTEVFGQGEFSLVKVAGSLERATFLVGDPSRVGECIPVALDKDDAIGESRPMNALSVLVPAGD